MNKLRFMKLSAHAVTPTRKHPYDAGLDLYACTYYNTDFSDTMRPVELHYSVQVMPHSFAIIPTKIAVSIPEGYAGFIWPKSKNDYLIGGGVVDSGYTGEIFVKVMNTSTVTQEIWHGQAIGQLIIQKVETPELELVSEFASTERGNSGGIVTQYKQETFLSAIDEVE